MKNKRKLILLSLGVIQILLITPLLLADSIEFDAGDSTTWDYSSDDFYTNLGTISSDDYSNINWNEFDWSNQNVNWNEFDFSSESFSFSNVDWSEVSESPDFHYSIASNADGALDKYKSEYGLTGDDKFKVSSGSEEKITFGDGQISTDLGKVTFSEHSDARFIVQDDGEIRVIYEEKTSIDTSSFSADTKGTFIFLDDEEGSSTISTTQGDIPVEGKLHFDAVWFIPKNEDVTVNGMIIKNTGDSDAIVYFPNSQLSEKESQGNILGIREEIKSFGPGESSIYIGSELFIIERNCEECTSEELQNPSLIVKVSSDNTYGIPVKKTGEGSFGIYDGYENNDLLEISTHDGAFVWNKGENEATVYGDVSINNGLHETRIQDANVYDKAIRYSDTIEYGSVPLTINMYDNVGNNPTIGSGVSNIISFDNAQSLEMGDPPASHFSVLIDPYEIVDITSGNEPITGDNINVINNLKLSGASQPFLIIVTPDEEYTNELLEAAEVYSSASPKGTIPLIIKEEGNNEVQVNANNFLLDQIISNPDHLSSDIPVRIIGHSASVNYEYFEISSTDSGGNIKTERYYMDQFSGQYFKIKDDGTRVYEDVYSIPEYATRGYSNIAIVKTGVDDDDQYNFVFEGNDPRKDSPVGCNLALQEYNDEKAELIIDIEEGNSISLSSGEVRYVELIKGDSKQDLLDGKADYYLDNGFYTIYIRDEGTRAFLKDALNDRLDSNTLSNAFANFEVDDERSSTLSYDNSNPPALKVERLSEVAEYDTKYILRFEDSLSDSDAVADATQ